MLPENVSWKARKKERNRLRERERERERDADRSVNKQSARSSNFCAIFSPLPTCIQSQFFLPHIELNLSSNLFSSLLLPVLVYSICVFASFSNCTSYLYLFLFLSLCVFIFIEIPNCVVIYFVWLCSLSLFIKSTIKNLKSLCICASVFKVQ